jgi:hypothetical protein
MRQRGARPQPFEPGSRYRYRRQTEHPLCKEARKTACALHATSERRKDAEGQQKHGKDDPGMTAP